MMSNQMTALEKSKPEQGLWKVEAPIPEIGPDDVLVKIKKTGICGTDIHIWNWDEWAASTVPIPLITGHEFAGEIVELGRRVEGLRSGNAALAKGILLVWKADNHGRANSTLIPVRVVSALIFRVPLPNIYVYLPLM